MVYHKKIIQKAELIRIAPEEKRGPLVMAALESFKLDTENLTKQQRYELAIKEIEERARRFAIKATVVGIIAALVAATLLRSLAIPRVSAPSLRGGW